MLDGTKIEDLSQRGVILHHRFIPVEILIAGQLLHCFLFGLEYDQGAHQLISSSIDFSHNSFIHSFQCSYFLLLPLLAAPADRVPAVGF